MSTFDQPQSVRDNAEPQIAQPQTSAGPLVDMTSPDTRSSFQLADSQGQSTFSHSGQMMFSNPYIGNLDRDRKDSGHDDSPGRRFGGDSDGHWGDNAGGGWRGYEGVSPASDGTKQLGGGSGQGDMSLSQPNADSPGVGSDAGEATAQSSGDSLDQQIQTLLQAIEQQLQQLSLELNQLIGGSSGGIGSNPAVDSTGSPPSTSNGAGSDSSGSATTTASAAGSDSSGSATTTPPGAGSDSTGSAITTAPETGSDSSVTATSAAPGPGSGSSGDTTIATPPSSTSIGTSHSSSGSNAQPGDYSAIGPDGSAVGSTATAFGPGAMPEVSKTAPAFYVSATNSSNNGNGSSADPFATLQEAQQAMENSNIKTTYVEGGTYNLSSPLNLTAADSGETFIADNSRGAVTLDGGGTASNLIAIDGANNVSVEGFTMQNTAPTPQLWTQADWFATNTGGDAIMATNSSGDNFSYNSVHNVGIAFNLEGVSNSKVDGNDISDVQQAVNLIQGGSWAGANNNSNNMVDSNRIENVSNISGVAGNYVGAIGLTRAVNASLTNNVIENTQGAGVEIQDSDYGGLTVQEKDITVSGNTINNTNTAALASEDWNTSLADESLHPFDMGSIYVSHGLDASPGNLDLNISDNYITNVGAGISNYGIYLDNTVSGAEVEGNIVRGGGSASDMVIHGGSDNTVENNVFDLTSATGNEKGIFLQSTGPQMQNNVINNNIFYANGANGGAVPTEIQPGDEPAISGNDYWGTASSGLPYESNATNTNPQFTDPSSGSYSTAG